MLLCAIIQQISYVAIAQDVIITKDAQKIDAKIIEVSKSEIKYKEIDNLDGPTFVLGVDDINSIVYSNGKVTAYNSGEYEQKSSKNDNASETPSQLQQKSPMTNKTLSPEEKERIALLEYLDGFPKKIVAFKGDYSIIYNKNATIYFDYDFDNAECVVCGYEILHCEPQEESFVSHLNMRGSAVDKDEMLQYITQQFNQKMFSKCILRPISDFNENTYKTTQTYKMLFRINQVDVGSDWISWVSINNGTNTGGAVMSGEIEVRNAMTDELCCTLIVDRVQGKGFPDEFSRIKSVMEEVICSSLFRIKKFKK